jgi:hypothetical protein
MRMLQAAGSAAVMAIGTGTLAVFVCICSTEHWLMGRI